MELRDFAEAVLFSAELSTKLTDPGSFTDRHPGKALTGAVLPGRPDALPLVARLPIPAAPTPRSIEDERTRGQALHTFAHHELQALELMALALLRFPDAPAGFRKGLAHIICDEQRHFRLYQGRAERWGVSLGDVGVGHFFWNTVADLRDVSSFVAALSLTYEQANLDFAAFWKPAFTAVDDVESAEALQAVYEDEIRHVAHGVTWFGRLNGRADFEAYRAALASPLTPGRAKGPVFDRAARLQAGFSEAFVDEVEIHPITRGRACRVFSFDPFVEEQVARRTPKAQVLSLKSDLASLPMFLAGRDDVVVAPRPSRASLLRLHRTGFVVPEFVESHAALDGRAIASLHPWGWSPAAAKQHGTEWRTDQAQLYDKRWSLGLRRTFAQVHAMDVLATVRGEVCAGMEEVEALVSQGGEWIAKAPLSSSGQHRVRLRHPVDDRARAWLNRWLAKDSVVVEPWYERVADVSVQLEVHDDRVEEVGLTRFWTAGGGAYRGAHIGAWTQGLPPQVARAVHGGVRGGVVSGVLRQAGAFVGEALRARGYRGPAGVDAMVVRTEDGLQVVPILEVNPRYTMGRIALGIRRQCAGVGGWLFVTRKAMRAAGYSDVAAFRRAVEAVAVEVRDSGLRSGIVFTTDPDAAQGVMTVLVVGESLGHAASLWEGLGMVWPEST